MPNQFLAGINPLGWLLKVLIFHAVAPQLLRKHTAWIRYRQGESRLELGSLLPKSKDFGSWLYLFLGIKGLLGLGERLGLEGHPRFPVPPGETLADLVFCTLPP